MNNRVLFVLCAILLFSQVAFRKRAPPGFTVVVNTFRSRDDNLLHIVDTYRRCQGVKQVIIMWNDVDRLPESTALNNLKGAIMVTPKINVISNRFLVEDLLTDGVFHTDDDILYSCGLLEDTFKVWLKNQDSMVGYAPRWMLRYKHRVDYEWDGAYRHGKYNTLWLTKGGFIHRKYMDVYRTDSAYDKIRTMVNEFTTGEDILMSLIHKELGSGYVPVQVNPGQYLEFPDKDKHINLVHRAGSHRTTVLHEVYRYMKSIDSKNLFDNIERLDWLNKTLIRI